ncbi:MAG: MauE/DoxX family redox-associated membrane protein [Ignavibacteria bacterium]
MKEFLSNKYVVVTLRVLLGLIFIYSSIGKLFNQADFAKAILRYDFLPIYFVNLLAIVLPWLEFIVGLLLIAGIYKKASAFLAGASLVMFLIALISAAVRGLDISCGCFSLEESSSKGDIIFRIIQDFFMLAAVIIVYKFGDDKKEEAPEISTGITN